MSDTAAKIEARAALLDAAERLLISTGYAEISTRRLAEEAGVNHGLVHYYFGSMDELFAQVLERFTERLIARQRAMYARDVPFLEKWRTAMSYLDEDLESGYQKVWLELQALAWNKPALRDRVVHVDEEWRAVVTEAIQGAVEAYDIDTDTFPVEAIVSLVATFNLGMILERHSGVSTGHRELLAAIDSWLQTLDVGVRS
ncbi:MAG: TetR/AcrR family transcriptional regulator [Actinomycetota bacterium]|nr:TetR/AcrR family transcriptional regulator [Actinomycetota bacterium]